MLFGFSDKRWLVVLYFTWVLILPIGILLFINDEKLKKLDTKARKRSVTSRNDINVEQDFNVHINEVRSFKHWIFLFTSLAWISYLWAPRVGSKPLATMVDYHETLHFKGLQSGLVGNLPYVGAGSEQYGPASQLFTLFWLKVVGEPSVVAMRESSFMLNYFAIIFFTVSAFIFLGHRIAIFSLICSSLLFPTFSFYRYTENGMLGWWGWANNWRYAGVFFVAISFSKLALHPKAKNRGIGFVIVGIVWITTCLLAQENFLGGSLVLVCISAILLLAKVISGRSILKAWLHMGVGSMIVLLPYLFPYVKTGKLLSFVENYLLVPVAVSRGYSNTPWREQNSWSVIYGLGPVIAIFLLGLLLIAYAQAWNNLKSTRQNYVRFLSVFGLAIGAVIAQAGSLTRSDSTHLINSFVLLPFFLIATLILLLEIATKKISTIAVVTAVAILCLFQLPTNFYWVSEAGLHDRFSAPLNYKSETPLAFATQSDNTFQKRMRNLVNSSNGPILNSSNTSSDDVLKFASDLKALAGKKITYIDPENPKAFGGQVGFWYFASDLNPAQVPFEEMSMAISQAQKRRNLEYLQKYPPEVYFTSNEGSELSKAIIQSMGRVQKLAVSWPEEARILVFVSNY
jgi:hypothetical protein